MRSIASLSLLFVGIFRLLQGSVYAPYLWLELKVLNMTVLTALVASLVLYQYTLALLILLLMVVMRFAACMVPIQEAYDFTWSSHIIRSVICVVWLIFTIGSGIVIFLGTILE